MAGAGAMQRRRVTVFMNHSQDPAEWAARHRAGETIDPTPYGYGLAEEWFDLSWAHSHRESARVRRWRLALAGRLGFDLVHAWRNRKILFAADAVWTHTEFEHLAVAFLQRLVPSYRRTRVLAQTIWLWDRWPELGRVRRGLYSWLLRAQSVECTHSPLNLAVSRGAVPHRRVLLVPFGTRGLESLTAQPDAGARGWDVVAPGNDQHRDWSTLAEVAQSRPHLTFWVASGSSSARATAWPANAHVAKVPDPSAYATLLANAEVCVLALKPNLHASGMTSALEAASVATPVVVAGDGGLPVILGPGPRFVAAGDAGALASAIDHVVAGGSTETSVPDVAGRGLTQRDYVTRYALITDMICGDRPWGDHVSALSPQTRDPGSPPGRRP